MIMREHLESSTALYTRMYRYVLVHTGIKRFLRLVTGPTAMYRTAWNIEKICPIASLKGLRLVHIFRGPLKELTNTISGSRRRPQKVDGFSNNKRSNGSKTHPLKSAILISRASRSVVRHLREKSPNTSSRYKSPETDLQVPGGPPEKSRQP